MSCTLRILSGFVSDWCRKKEWLNTTTNTTKTKKHMTKLSHPVSFLTCTALFM